MIPEVSILVPIYGVEKFIERCAISLFEQTFKNIEYIFINDNTPDNSIAILKKVLKNYPNRIEHVKILNNDVNRGIAANRNIAIAHATGIYTLFVDSDDYIEKDAVELLYNKAVTAQADICVCDYYMEWEDSRINMKQNIEGKSKQEIIKLMISGQTEVCLWNKLVKRSLYIDHGIKTIDGINLGEDFFQVVQLSHFSNKIVKVNKPLYHYIKFNSNSHTKQVKVQYINDLKTIIGSITQFTYDQGVYEVYEKDILEFKLRMKLDFLLKVDESLIDYVIKLFPETSKVEKSIALPLRDKTTLAFVKLNNLTIIKMYLRSFRKVFQAYQKLRKR